MRNFSAIIVLLGLFFGGCMSQSAAPQVLSTQATARAVPNRLDAALAAPKNAPAAERADDWFFSALLVAEGRRLPLLVLVRPPTETSLASNVKFSEGYFAEKLEAEVLTESSLGLCSLDIEPTAVRAQQKLPGVQVQRVCEQVGLALQRIFLEPQPDGHEHTVSPAQVQRPHGRSELHVLFSPDGVLLEKSERKGGATLWHARYSGSAKQGRFYIPAACRYKSGAIVFSLLRLKDAAGL